MNGRIPGVDQSPQKRNLEFLALPAVGAGDAVPQGHQILDPIHPDLLLVHLHTPVLDPHVLDLHPIVLTPADPLDIVHFLVAGPGQDLSPRPHLPHRHPLRIKPPLRAKENLSRYLVKESDPWM